MLWGGRGDGIGLHGDAGRKTTAFDIMTHAERTGDQSLDAMQASCDHLG